MKAADWIGLPQTITNADGSTLAGPHLPLFSMAAILVVIPGVIALVAENAGHVKAVAEMTGENLDKSMGAGFIGDGVGTAVSAFAGGPPTTTYAKPVPIAELVGFPVTDNTTVPGVVTRDGGDAFIFTADLYEAVVATPRLQYADIKHSPKVGPDLTPGERFIGAWLVKARDGEWYIVTPYWTRILLKDVKRIGDVPNLAAGAA